MVRHPRIYSRAAVGLPAADPRPRVLVYTPMAKASAWVEQELANEQVVVHTAASVAAAVNALIDEPPPRPQMLVVDLDAMNAGELLHLHSIREHGWFGCLIAIGSVPVTLRLSLRIEKVITAPYPRDALRGIVSQATNAPVNTVRMPRING